MKNWQYILFGALLVVIGLLGFLLGRNYPRNGQITEVKTKVDTLVIYDTIKTVEPIYITKKVITKELIPVTDTLRIQDTLYINMDREQIVWKDSLSTIYASGIHPQIDSVYHYTSTQYITKEITKTITTPKPKFTFGVQVGIGAQYGIIHNQFDLGPYCGIGIQYNF